jgi:hypothetical protein
MDHNYTHSFIKPIVLDKRKIYTTTKTIQEPDNYIVIKDNKQDRVAQDSLNKRSLLHRDSVTFSSDEL